MKCPYCGNEMTEMDFYDCEYYPVEDNVIHEVFSFDCDKCDGLFNIVKEYVLNEGYSRIERVKPPVSHEFVK